MTVTRGAFSVVALVVWSQTQAAALPSATEVVARYDHALGGAAALRRHTSETMRGTVEAGDKSLLFTYYAAAPYLRLEKTTLPDGKGDVLNGFDGEIAWSADPRSGTQISAGEERESAKRDADFYYPLDELTWFKSMEVVGVEVYEGHRCYHLHGINNWGKWNDHFYATDTGLLAGYEFEAQLSDGPRTVHEIFSDYRRIDGVMVPMKQTVKVKAKSGNGWTVLETINYAVVTFNDVDPKVFAPPQAVVDLAGKQTSN